MKTPEYRRILVHFDDLLLLDAQEEQILVHLAIGEDIGPTGGRVEVLHFEQGVAEAAAVLHPGLTHHVLHLAV